MWNIYFMDECEQILSVDIIIISSVQLLRCLRIEAKILYFSDPHSAGEYWAASASAETQTRTCFSPQCITFACASEPSTRALHQHPPTCQKTKTIQTILMSLRCWLVNGVSFCMTMTPIQASSKMSIPRVVLWLKQCTELGPIGFIDQWRMVWSGTHTRVGLGLCQNQNQWHQGTWSLLTQCGRNAAPVLYNYLYMYQ